MGAVRTRSSGAFSNSIVLFAAISGLSGTPALANLIANPSFEVGPGDISILPTDWNIWNATPDTWGIGAATPDFTFGTGAVAHEADRWVAAFSAGSNPEAFSQTLSAALSPGQTYLFSSWLLEADPQSFSVSAGGYDAWLGTSTTNDELLGTLSTTTGVGDWEFRAILFDAPANSASLSEIIFIPQIGSSADAWTGMDDTSLEVIPDSLLVAFPNSSQSVVDGDTNDLDTTVNNEILLADWPVPDSLGNATDLEFTGRIVGSYVWDSNDQTGIATVTITDGFITNTSLTSRVLVGSTPSGPSDYGDMLEFVFFTHGPILGTSSLSLTIDGGFGKPDSLILTGGGDSGTTDQQIRLGLSDTLFVPDSDSFARAFWLRPADISNPVPVNANDTEVGTFSLNSGSTLQIHIDDALVLGSAFDTLTFPTSIVARVATPPPVPAVSEVGLLLMTVLAGIALLVWTAR